MDGQQLSYIATTFTVLIVSIVAILVTSVISICWTYTDFVGKMNIMIANLVENQQKQTNSMRQIMSRLKLLEKRLQQQEEELHKQNERDRIYS